MPVKLAGVALAFGSGGNSCPVSTGSPMSNSLGGQAGLGSSPCKNAQRGGRGNGHVFDPVVRLRARYHQRLEGKLVQRTIGHNDDVRSGRNRFAHGTQHGLVQRACRVALRQRIAALGDDGNRSPTPKTVSASANRRGSRCETLAPRRSACRSGSLVGPLHDVPAVD
jgi:hypothetical protein